MCVRKVSALLKKRECLKREEKATRTEMDEKMKDLERLEGVLSQLEEKEKKTDEGLTSVLARSKVKEGLDFLENLLLAKAADVDPYQLSPRSAPTFHEIFLTNDRIF